MSDHAAQVRVFHERFNVPIANPTDGVRAFRVDLLAEEWNEYLEAEEAQDFVKIADGLGDMLYVIYGTALAYGIDLDAVVNEIHRSNMTKTPGVGGKPEKLDDYEFPALVPILFPGLRTSQGQETGS